MQLYDGTRLYVGAGTITYPFDTWNIDRIEVLRGPASVLYGDGAIGGVINVVPKKPVAAPITAARAALGSDGVKRLAFDSGGPIGESVFYRLNVSGNQANGWLRQNGDFANLAVSGSVLYQATPDLAFTLSHDYGYQEPLRYFGTPLIGGRLDPRLRFQNYNVNDSRIVFQDNWTQLKTEWTPTADITIRNTAYRLLSDRHWRNVESYAFVPATGLVRRTSPIEIFHDQEQIGNRFDAAFRARCSASATSSWRVSTSTTSRSGTPTTHPIGARAASTRSCSARPLLQPRRHHAGIRDLIGSIFHLRGEPPRLHR